MWVGWVDVNGLEAWWVGGLMGGPLVSVDGLMGANTSVQTLVAKDCPGKYRHRRCLCLCLIFLLLLGIAVAVAVSAQVAYIVECPRGSLQNYYALAQQCQAETTTRTTRAGRSSSATTKTATTTVLITAETTIPPQKHGHNGRRRGLAYQLTNAMRNCKCKIPARVQPKDVAKGVSQVGGAWFLFWPGFNCPLKPRGTHTHRKHSHVARTKSQSTTKIMP